MVLVTGATGLVGSYLLLHLIKNGESVTALYRDEKSIEKTKALFQLYQKSDSFKNVQWVKGDIIDIPSLEEVFINIDYVYHCAAKISFDPRDEEKLRKINIEGTANIVNFCLAKNVKKLCFVSSISALGDLPSSQSITDEETDWNAEKPHSDYAISKYGAEMEIWRGHQEGLNVVIVNPGVILGALPKSWNREEGSYKIITSIAKGLKYFTAGSTGFVGVTDVVKCMALLMNSDANGERYILVSENLPYKDIIDIIAKKLNVNAPKIEAKPWMTRWAWRLDWIRSNLFCRKRSLTRAISKSLHTKDVYSSQKLHQQLNYQFQPMEEVIQEIANKY
ncbi:MAG: NAD-dependent epimerase/dehydratase family protein [Pedobacter sp.]|nr:MAG: NAD-dependent epimerase/dehydratase family protein [Pedobacter sp.]